VSRRGMSWRGLEERTVRIIAGRFRGRRIGFLAVPGLRPTPDRVRETLFNWLQGVVPGSRCLDLFAGSGALGFEALSRGASEVVLVESDPAAVGALKKTATVLGASGLVIEAADAFQYLARLPVPFDLVFLDPPFASGRLPELCTLLENGGWLAPRALIYLESAARDPSPELPESWERLRETRAGEVRATLARRAAGDSVHPR
jgi:16S rRNA (guanine966-N2)-methyltransferase